jgi:hypothetical protein
MSVLSIVVLGYLALSCAAFVIEKEMSIWLSCWFLSE